MQASDVRAMEEDRESGKQVERRYFGGWNDDNGARTRIRGGRR